MAEIPQVEVDHDAAFIRAWACAERIPGWLTENQARVLWDAALDLSPGATIVEIGSHQGRSTVVLGRAAQLVGARLVAVDAFVDWLGGSSTRQRFEANTAAAGVSDVVDLVVGYSTHLRPKWTDKIDLLYVDGKHDYWTFTDDLRWSAHMPYGARVLVHDCFSSIGVTLGAVAKVLAGTRYAYQSRAGSLATFTVVRPSIRDRMRLLGELPWFARNVVVKVLLRLRARPVARLLGHHGAHDPY